ncbi:hypothetical protein X801_06309, partial [Opisthorchis viverrini]
MIATMLVMMHLAANVLASYDREHLSVHKELPVGVNPTIWILNWFSAVSFVLTISLMMVALWTVGDVGKSVFFMLEGAPFVFPLCGWFQVTLDCFIFGQKKQCKPISS